MAKKSVLTDKDTGLTGLTCLAEWRVNTVSMLKEMVENNPKMGIFRQPVNILGRILAEVAERAIDLNDPKLNQLMCRLALYEQSDPYAPGYNKKQMEYILSEKYLTDNKRAKRPVSPKTS